MLLLRRQSHPNQYLLGYEFLDGLLRDVGVGGADHERDRDLAGDVILLPDILTCSYFFLPRRVNSGGVCYAVDGEIMEVLRDDGGVSDGRVSDEQRLQLGRRHLHE